MISNAFYNQPQEQYSKSKRTLFAFYLFIVTMLALTTPSHAADFYVATTGSDSRTIEQAKNRTTPWKTIQKAADSVGPGSVVHIAPGIYNVFPRVGEKSAIYIRKSGTAALPITFVSDVRWGAKIKGSAPDALLRVHGNYIKIINFDFIGSGTAGAGILVSKSQVQIIGNRIHGITGSGIMTWNGSYKFTNIDILNNYIYDVGRNSHSHGIYVMHQYGSVTNNIIRKASGYGIHAWHAAYGLVFSHNLIFSCSEGGITVGAGDEPYNRIADNFVVTNNIAAFNGKYGIDENGATGSNNLYRNNLVYGNGWAAFELAPGRIPQKTLTVDPGLVNFDKYGAGDYHLSPTSRAINAGTTIGQQSGDFEGTVRTNAPDIGPYEYKPLRSSANIINLNTN